MTTRTTARLVGALFILASVTAIVGGTMVHPVEGGDLAEIADQEILIASGFLLELVLVASVVGIAVLLFPVLRRGDEGLALGYVAARIIEATLLLVAALAALVILAVAREPVTAPDPAVVTAAFVSLRTWTYLVGSMLALGVGALILYWLLYRSRVVPAWLSLWGLVGAALIAIRAIVEIYGIELDPAVQGAFAAPIALNEMVLAVWLIAKGFDERHLPVARRTEPSRALQEAS
jgi:hypothetical protein